MLCQTFEIPAQSCTDHTKATNHQQYLHFQINHPLRVKRSLPYILVTRAKLICAKEEDFNKKCQLFKTFTAQGYPKHTVNSQINRALSNQELINKQPSNDIPYRSPPSIMKAYFSDAENEDVGYSKDVSKSKLHEAGYDAYITDCANRDHVFHVSFLKEWKTNDLVKLFSPFGAVQVCWLDDTSAYVALNRPDQAKLVQKTLTQSDSYTVIHYSIYQRHESSCQCGRTYGKAVLACINMTKSLTQLVVSSPTTTNLRKRRSLELQQSEAHGKQLIALKKRSRSSGESSFSKRSIDPIPEEEEEEGTVGGLSHVTVFRRRRGQHTPSCMHRATTWMIRKRHGQSMFATETKGNTDERAYMASLTVSLSHLLQD
uniref:Uncharacterized protein n=1 Tax=Timema genevievae TaxID=629358 RepID=A0A7R9JNB0_TIMGE|nr:unnamed protein product [Timema genevievae]